MAPDRGDGHHTRAERAGSRGGFESTPASNPPNEDEEDADPLEHDEGRSQAQKALAARASEPQNFTFRGVLLGLAIGVIICFSNIYFGLQTGWISGMSMPSALIGFGFFRAISSHLKMPFTPVENVLIQTVASSVGTMPLGCGFVGVMPALEYLLKPEENGPLNLGLGKLCFWAVGICLFGCVFAVPLRVQVIIREKLKFPTGSATALMIGVLHGDRKDATLVKQAEPDAEARSSEEDETRPLREQTEESGAEPVDNPNAARAEQLESQVTHSSKDESGDWKTKIRILTFAFGGSAIYTIATYFIPQIRNVPIFGLPLANIWLWALNPSPAYVGQGIIMGPATTMHMLFGAILGWGVLSPLAKYKGWAAGPVDDWETGSKGWIVWISLAIMLADAIISLGWLILRPLINYSRYYGPDLYNHMRRGEWKELAAQLNPSSNKKGYTPLLPRNGSTSNAKPHRSSPNVPAPAPEIDAPPDKLVSTRAFLFWLVVSISLYFISVHLAFPIPAKASIVALLLALLLSLMGVRALGETDLNPVSGISKLTQLAFAFIVPASNPNSVIINLLAGAISEAGALQAGDLLQDLKTGHLLGAAPSAQFYGQIVGSVVGAVVSAAVYRLYTNVYTIPGPLFQMPTAYVWIFTARLVTGSGLPPHAAQFALVAACIWAVVTTVRTRFTVLRLRGEQDKRWWSWVPGGIAVAVGMYNTPSFTLARAVGGLITWWWTSWRGKGETTVVVLASGLILGEGLCSIVNLAMASAGVPHL